MRQRVFVVVLGHFGPALVSLPSFRSRKALRESKKRERKEERDRERESQAMSGITIVSLVLS